MSYTRWLERLLISSVGARSLAEPAAEYSSEIIIIAEAAGVGDFAKRLVYAKRLPAAQKVGGVIQTKRLDEMNAGGTPLRKELLKVAHRDPRFGRHLARAEVRIGKAALNDAADACKTARRYDG